MSMRDIKTLSNSCSVSETVKVGERFDATDKTARMDTTALRPHERWDLTV